MGKRLNRARAKYEHAKKLQRQFFEARYDKYGARDPFLRYGQDGFTMSDAQMRDLENYGLFGQQYSRSYFGMKNTYKDQMLGSEEDGGLDWKGRPIDEPKDPTAVTRDKYGYAVGGLAQPANDYRRYVYGKNIKANNIGVFMDKELADYEKREQEEQEYQNWKQKTDAELAKKAARVEYKRKGREVFGRAATYMGAEAGLVDDPEVRKKKMRGKMIMGE